MHIRVGRLVSTLLFMIAPAVALAQSRAESAKSVVQIRCATSHGEMKATGFVWPEPGLVVTALHAVAGCGAGTGTVYSEHAKKGTEIAEFVAVDLEGDLALVRLVDDLELAPVPFAEELPDIAGEHLVWGYPLAAEQMIGLRIEFALGLNAGTTTLGRAFSSSDLTKLFRNQDYPNRETQILRVTTTIQPGHSGAPVFDSEGRVVAIADGGLLGGWRGINWSIPAHVYLPDLPQSKDPFPENVSEQAELFSAYAVTDSKRIPLGDGALRPPESQPQEKLVATGHVPLPLVLEVLAVAEDDELAWMIDDLDEILPQRATWEAFKFTGLQSDRSGDLVFVPERASVEHDAAAGYVEARSVDGAVRQVSVRYEGENFEEALQTGSSMFFQRLRTLGAEDVPTAVPEKDIDRQLEYVDYSETLGDEDGPQATHFVVQLNGPYFSGRAIHASRSLDDMSDADYVDYLMMNLATFDLNSFWPLDEEIEEQIERPAISSSGFAPEPSSLSLVRRVPLVDVARDFVEAQDFEWKSDLSYLKSRLNDPGQFDELTFDVYEDHVTGATIAVPSGLDLTWNEDLGAAEASDAKGSLQLAIAVQRAPSFRAATGAGVVKFLGQLSEYAKWEDRAPADCELTIYPEDREAECWDYFQGEDRRTGQFADMYLAVDIRDDVFLGTSVYIVGDEEDLSDDEVITYLMMLVSAEHLSDFAAK